MDRNRELAMIAAAQRGDTQAFTELYNDSVDHVYRYIYYRVQSQAVAEDLTSDVFVQVLEKLGAYKDKSVPFLAWIYRIAHGRVIDYYRKSRFRDHQASLDDIDVGAEQDMDINLMDIYNTEHVHTAIHHLNEEQRQVIVLRFIEGHDLETTAQLLDRSVSAVKSLQYRATQSLIQLLSKQGFESDEYLS